MSDFTDDLVILSEFMISAEFGLLATPLKNPDDANEVVFSRFGISQPHDPFNKGWFFGIQEASEAKYTQAFTTGALRFEMIPNQSGILEPSLVLQSSDPLGVLIRLQELPQWFPVANYVFYKNIDMVETRTLLTAYLEREPKIIDSLCTDDDCEDVTTYLDKFFNEDVALGIPVKTGDIIAMAGSGSTHDRELTVEMQEILNSGIYIDPAIYPLHLETYFLDLPYHTLVPNFTNAFGPLVANGTIRYVEHQGNLTGTFDSPTAPAADISKAVDASSPYDTIVVLDSEQYVDSVIINHPLSITAINSEPDVRETTSHETFNLPELPVIQALAGRRCLLVDQVDGLVTISNLIFTGGWIQASASTGGPASTANYDPVETGPGVLIYKSNQVYLYNCCSINNRADNINDPILRCGGGLHIYECSPYIFRNYIAANDVIDGGGVFIGPFGFPILKENIITDNNARWDGGGICIQTAVANHFIPDASGSDFDEEKVEKARTSKTMLIRNTIRYNEATDDGGGVYLSIMSKVNFKDNLIHNNIARNAGGGVRATLGSDIEMIGDEIYENQANFDYSGADDTNGGGGIAMRNSDLNIKGVVIRNNIAHGFAGGGIYMNDASEGDLGTLAGLIAYDSYDEILQTLFLKSSVNLILDEDVEVFENQCTKIENTANDYRKGGGIYILRYKSPDFTALPLYVMIADFTNISANENNKISQLYAGNATGWVENVITDVFPPANPASDNVHIHDLVDEQKPPDQQQLINGVIDGNTALYFTDPNGKFEYSSD